MASTNAEHLSRRLSSLKYVNANLARVDDYCPDLAQNDQPPFCPPTLFFPPNLELSTRKPTKTFSRSLADSFIILESIARVFDQTPF